VDSRQLFLVKSGMITKPSVKGYFILVSEFTETYKEEQTCMHKRSQACPAHFQKRQSQVPDFPGDAVACSVILSARSVALQQCLLSHFGRLIIDHVMCSGLFTGTPFWSTSACVVRRPLVEGWGTLSVTR
jgi:hypothetical protein